MGCHAAACGNDAFGGRHSGKVFRTGLNAHHYYAVAFGVHLGRVVGEEYNLSAGGSRRCRQSSCEYFCALQCFLVEYRVQEFVKLVGLAAQKSRLFVYLAFAEQVHGYFHHCCACAFSVTCLQEPEFAFLYGELHVLHVVIVVFEFLLQCVELGVNLGHGLFH